jgi:hypothetical protein
MLLNNIDNKIIIYWIFNKNKDIFTTDTYNDINELSFEDFYRYMISTFYDIIIDITYQKIINSIQKCKTLHACNYISNNIQNKLINFSDNSKYNINLQKVFIETTKKKYTAIQPTTIDTIILIFIVFIYASTQNKKILYYCIITT